MLTLKELYSFWRVLEGRVLHKRTKEISNFHVYDFKHIRIKGPIKPIEKCKANLSKLVAGSPSLLFCITYTISLVNTNLTRSRLKPNFVLKLPRKCPKSI